MLETAIQEKEDTLDQLDQVQPYKEYNLYKKDISDRSHIPSLHSTGDYCTSGIATMVVFKFENFRKQDLFKMRIQSSFPYIIESCITAIDRAIENISDPILFDNALNELRDYLNKLWEIRKTKKEYFSHLINVLQVILLKTEEESFEISTIQLKAIKKILKDISILSFISKAELKDYLKILQKAGCDVYRAIR